MALLKELKRDVTKIANSSGLESEVLPMKLYRPRGNLEPNDWCCYKQMRIIFKIDKAGNPIKRYVYCLSPYEWDKINECKKSYKEFLGLLNRRINEIFAA